MPIANNAWFDRPETKLKALGYNTSLNPERRRGPEVTSNGVAQSLIANGGLVDPKARVIAANTNLVRFSSGVLVPQVAAGEWWLDWDNYKIVESHADSAGISVPAAVRLLCCVPVEWSAMTILVQARAIRPLLAYEGAGAPATVNGGSVHLDGGLAARLGVKQLFIPGLSDPDLRRDSLLVTGYGLLPHELSLMGYVTQAMP